MIRSRYPTLFKVLPWLITGMVVGVAVGALVWFSPPTSRPPLEIALLIVAFYVSQNLLVQYHARGLGIAFNLTDIPLAIAVFFIPPFWVVAARLASSLIYYSERYIRQDINILKPLFNLGMTVSGTAVVAGIVQVVGVGGATDLSTWAVIVGAIFVNGLLTTVWISALLFSLSGWDSVVKAWQAYFLTLIGPLLASSVGLIFLVLLDASPWTAVLIGFISAAVYFMARSYMRLRRQRHILGELNNFTQLVADSVRSNRLIDAMLGRLREILSAESATVWVPAGGRYPEIRLTAELDEIGLTDLDPVPQGLQREVIESAKPMLVDAKAGTRRQREILQEAGLRGAMLVPLRAGDDVYGCLSLADRIGGELSRFTPVDLELLETIAAHVSVAVDNSRLIDQLHHDAYHDPLTSLANRRRSLEALGEALSITVSGEVVAVLMFDMDGLHEINDALGHEAGDALLVEFSRRLTRNAPDASFIGRIDSDEFILQTRLPSTEAAAEIARELRQTLGGPFEFGGVAVDVSAAVGVVTHPDFATDADELLQRADTATRQAKNSADGVQVYHSGLESESLRRIGLAADLRRALDAGELGVHFQPKVRLETGELTGAEALVRWSHPTYGSVPPEEFIAIAGSTGQLGRLTGQVLDEALRRSAEWDFGSGPLPMAVNLSPRTLADAGFPGRVAELLDAHGVAPGVLTFEITEDDMVADGSRLSPVLDRLHEMGVRLSVDDFGTGYSSLSYLRRLPIQEIKIDMRFVQGMDTDADDRAIVKAVLDLARHFEIDVVAEGIESHRTVDQLRELACETGQGYYFSRPLPPDRFAAWLRSQDGGAEPGRLHVV